MNMTMVGCEQLLCAFFFLNHMHTYVAAGVVSSTQKAGVAAEATVVPLQCIQVFGSRGGMNQNESHSWWLFFFVHVCQGLTPIISI